MSEQSPEKKYSVYIAILAAVGLAGYSLHTTGSVAEVQTIVTELIVFAGARQAIKSFLKK